MYRKKIKNYKINQSTEKYRFRKLIVLFISIIKNPVRLTFFLCTDLKSRKHGIIFFWFLKTGIFYILVKTFIDNRSPLSFRWRVRYRYFSGLSCGFHSSCDFWNDFLGKGLVFDSIIGYTGYIFLTVKVARKLKNSTER